MKGQSKPFIYSGENCIDDFKLYLNNSKYSKIIFFTDENTNEYCYPLIAPSFENHINIQIPSGEENKNIETCSKVWDELSKHNFDRNAVVVNLGGGVICDMGGFIAATYKRGIDFIHFPTTLLSMCDASIGGKLGVNHNGLKNYIGLFRNPRAIVIYPEFLKTLPDKQMLSGFAEVIKHAIIADRKLFNDLYLINDFTENIEKYIHRSVKIKSRIVNLDMHEKGVRKSINFGHSIGHALESWFIISGEQENITHGEAVAAGMISESWIAYKRKFVTEKELSKIVTLIKNFYKKIIIDVDKLGSIAELIDKDKKNEKSEILFTLPDGIGNFHINEKVNHSEIMESLEYYQNI
ncbi:MAG TPA: 3-dehydroquinate synthase [Bacteroidales bacterium]|nr:3-dehydroquinate synthase [Bacteroidales bacterium]HPS17769.1 3-dehydroquinate synthase [Bacteroidales bacterium]